MFDNKFGNSAVSPVVGVILMVAVTVILAAVIGAFVLDLGGNTKQNPQASVTFDEDSSTGEVTVQVIAMDNAEEVVVKYDGGSAGLSSVGDSVTVDSAGEVVTVTARLDDKEAVIQTYHPEYTASESGVSADYVVAKDGSGDFDNIGDAVNAAGDGEEILVQDGTYEEEGIVLDKNVTVNGTSGAVLDGTNIANTEGTCDTDTDCSFAISGNAEPTINGLTIDGYKNGIYAEGTSGNWVLSNTTIKGGDYGVYAISSSGDWLIQDSEIANTSWWGVHADSTTGSWVVDNSNIHDNQYHGIYATNADPWGDASTSTFSGHSESDCKGNVTC